MPVPAVRVGGYEGLAPCLLVSTKRVRWEIDKAPVPRSGITERNEVVVIRQQPLAGQHQDHTARLSAISAPGRGRLLRGSANTALQAKYSAVSGTNPNESGQSFPLGLRVGQIRPKRSR